MKYITMILKAMLLYLVVLMPSIFFSSIGILLFDRNYSVLGTCMIILSVFIFAVSKVNIRMDN